MKKQIENIFSKTKVKKEPTCPNLKVPIIIDTREKQSLIAANLIEKKANIDFEQLEIGDYLIQDTIIERKTFSDFVGSMINKRLFDQLREIKKYPKYFIILEGFDYNYQKYRMHENQIRGTLLTIATSYQIPIIYTYDFNDTIKFLILTANRYNNPRTQTSIRETKTMSTPEQQKQFILEGFPGIGPTLAKNLLQKFPTLKEIFNATEEQLKTIPKLHPKKIKNILTLLNHSPANEQP